MSIGLTQKGSYGNTRIPLHTLYGSTAQNSELIHTQFGVIRIGSGVKKVLVSGAAFARLTNAPEYLWCRIERVRGSSIFEAATSLSSSNNYFAAVSLAPILVDVQEGDEIGIVKLNMENDELRADRNTWLTVEVVE